MMQSGRYARMLGHLGAFLARQGAHQIQIADEGEFLSVSWLPAGASRRQGCFRESELDNVAPLSGRERGASGAAMLLGALGMRLDLTGLDVARIEQTADGFTVSASSCGRYSNQRFPYAALHGIDEPRPDRLPAYLTERPRSRTRGSRSRTFDTARSRSLDTGRSRTMPLSAPDRLVEAQPPQLALPSVVDSPLRRRLQLA